MVVGAYVEALVVVAVVPAHQFLLRLPSSTGLRGGMVCIDAMRHLRQEPTAGDDGMGPQERWRRGGPHLAGDDTGEIALHGQFVDDPHPIAVGLQPQHPLEGLRLLALPMESDADRDLGQRERRLRGMGSERERVV